jgi:hypothetical protein
MSTESASHASSTVIVASSPVQARQPEPWFAEAIVLLRASGSLRRALTQQVRVERGRMGLFETVDFGLALVLHVIRGERAVSDTYEALFEDEATHDAPRALRPSMKLLPALWERQTLPSRSALSRWLDDVTDEATAALRDAFAAALHRDGLTGPSMGGCLDRRGDRHVLFDADGTAQTARQRALVEDAARPKPRRRRPLMAKGHAGRKRGEIVRTRLVVQQAHTQQWLGSFGHAGNTDLIGDLMRAAAAMTGYLTARALAVGVGLCRLDGLYGHAATLAVWAATGLGWLVRCADYRLLAHPQLLAALTQQTPTRLVSPDSGLVRTVYDIGFLRWSGGKGKNVEVWTRLVLTLRDALPSEAQKLRIGKRFRGQVAELFCTDRAQEAWLATDVLSLYLGRGAFERTLGFEDTRTDPDRFVSAHAPGQELFQVLCQWVDNTRLQLAHQEQDLPPRQVLWAEAQDPQPLADTACAQDEPSCAGPGGEAPPVAARDPRSPTPRPGSGPTPDGPAGIPTATAPRPTAPAVAQDDAVATAAGLGVVARAFGRGSGRFAGDDFVWQQDGTLRCPQGHTLRRSQSPRPRTTEIYRAQQRDCAGCPLSAQCLGGGSAKTKGRRVTVFPAVSPDKDESTAPAPAPAEPEPEPDPVPLLPLVAVCGPHPVLWQDVPAMSLRRRFQRALRSQAVQITPLPGVVPEPLPPAWQTRAQRAHQRLCYEERLARNARRPSMRWHVHLSGVSERLAVLLGVQDPPPC